MISYTILEGSTRICNEFVYEKTATITYAIPGCDDQAFTATEKRIEFESLNKSCEYTSNFTFIYEDNGPSFCLTENQEGKLGSDFRCNYESYSQALRVDRNNNVTELFPVPAPVCIYSQYGPCNRRINTKVTYVLGDGPQTSQNTTTTIKTKTTVPTSTTSMVPISNFSFTFNGSSLMTVGASVKITTQGSRTVPYNSLGITTEKIEGIPPFETVDATFLYPYAVPADNIGGYIGGYSCNTLFTTLTRSTYYLNQPTIFANQRLYYNTAVELTNYFPYWYRDGKETFEDWKNKTEFLEPVQKGVKGPMAAKTQFTVSYLEPLSWIVETKALACLTKGAIVSKKNAAISVTTDFNYNPPLVSSVKTVEENVTITNLSRSTTNLEFNGLDFISYEAKTGGEDDLSIEDKLSLLLSYRTFDPNPGVVTREIKQSYVSTLSQIEFEFAKFRIPYYKIENQEIEDIYLSNKYTSFYGSNCEGQGFTIKRSITHYISQEYNKIPNSPDNAGFDKFYGLNRFGGLDYLNNSYLDISYYGRAVAPNSTSSYYTNVFLSNSKTTTNFGGDDGVSIFPNLTIPIKQLTPTFTEQRFGQTLNKTIDGSFLSKANVSFTTTSNINNILTTITLVEGSSWKASGPLKLETAWTIHDLSNNPFLNNFFEDYRLFSFIKNIRGVCSIGNTKTSITRVYFPGYYMSYDNDQINKVQLVKELLTVSSMMPGDGFLIPTVQHIVVDNIYDHNISSPQSFFKDTQAYLPEVIQILNQDENLDGVFTVTINVFTALNACYNH
jgi:hypothetical protein